MPTPVHVIAGFLGAGKTTLLLDQLARREGQERCAVVVNDFGEARIDATLLGGQVAVTEIAGGCVCCTAPEALVPSLQAIIEAQAPDRVFIEATGLARPADIVDTLRRSAMATQLDIRPVVVVVDPARLLPEPPPLLAEQVDAADVVVLNKADEAPEAAWDVWARLASEQYPPLLAAPRASRSVVPLSLFDLRRDGPVAEHDHAHHHHHSTEGYSAASRVWPAERVFDAAALRAALEASGAERIKGLFRTDIGWYRFDRTGQQVNGLASPMRSASAVDVIVEGTQAEAEAILAALDAAEYTPPEAADAVLLDDASGARTPLTRWSLAALPGQVPDVSEHVPGREGRGVWLREVLALAGGGAQFVVVASDGMTTEPAPLDQVGEAILVHSLGDGPYPAKDGGPFRVFVPPGEGRSACSNVKKVVRVVVQAG